MRNLAKMVWVFAALLCVVPTATPKPKPAEEDHSGTLVIVFKDGRRESFRVEDIARIEFQNPVGSTAVAGRAHFLGRWKVDDGLGRKFFITLKPDGVARKTIGSEKGTWTVVNGEAQISWDDGWHDVLRKVGSRYEKAAYEPGRSLTETPSNVTAAEYTEPK
jgi:hypothetical protein